jgi:hypothetical protein
MPIQSGTSTLEEVVVQRTVQYVDGKEMTQAPEKECDRPFCHGVEHPVGSGRLEEEDAADSAGGGEEKGGGCESAVEKEIRT